MKQTLPDMKVLVECHKELRHAGMGTVGAEESN